VTSGDVPAATEASLSGRAQHIRQTLLGQSSKGRLPKLIAAILVLTTVAIPVLAGAGVRAHRLDVSDGNVLVADPINQQLVEYNSLTEQVVSTINARQLADATYSVKQDGGGNPVIHNETDGAIVSIDTITGTLGASLAFPTREIQVGIAGEHTFVAELPTGKVSLFDPTRLSASGGSVEIGSAITHVSIDSSRSLNVLTTGGELVSVSKPEAGARAKETSRITVTTNASKARLVSINNDTLIIEPGHITRVRNGVIVAKTDTPNDGSIKVPEQSIVGDLFPILSSAAGVVLLVTGDSQPVRIDLKDPKAFTAAPIVLNGRVYLRNDRTRQIVVLDAQGQTLQTIAIPGTGPIDVTVDEQRIWINPGGSVGLIVIRPDGSVINKARGTGDGSAGGHEQCPPRNHHRPRPHQQAPRS
jgi:hypothetical protein